MLTKAVEHLTDNGDAATCPVGALATIACRFEELKNRATIVAKALQTTEMVGYREVGLITSGRLRPTTIRPL